MNENEILYLANANGYKVVNARPTSDSFLRFSRKAIVGFPDFDAAAIFAEEFGMRVHQILKYDNVDMWVNEGLAISEIDTLEIYRDYGYNIVEPGEFIDERDFFGDFALKYLSDCQTIDEAKDVLGFAKEVWGLYKSMNDDEIIIAEEDNIFKTKRFTMKHHFNGATRQIACIPKLI